MKHGRMPLDCLVWPHSAMAVRRAPCRGAEMIAYYNRHPVWSLVVFLVAAFFVWAIFAAWPPGLEAVLGKKKVFLNAIFNGITLGGLYFLVASGFTLIFGLMKNVNLAHGSLYLLGGYVGYFAADITGYWLLAFPIAFVVEIGRASCRERVYMSGVGV